LGLNLTPVVNKFDNVATIHLIQDMEEGRNKYKRKERVEDCKKETNSFPCFNTNSIFIRFILIFSTNEYKWRETDHRDQLNYHARACHIVAPGV